MNNLYFVDAQEMNRDSPKSFGVPSNKELRAIREGDTVKVCNGSERFWVTVTGRKNGNIIGTVNNNLIDVDNIDLGDEIRFSQVNVYDIY